MRDLDYVTRRWPFAPVLLAGVLLCTAAASADENDLDDVLKSAKTTTAPSGEPNPDSQPAARQVDPLGTIKSRAPAESRLGTITLNTGKTLEGRIWTTLQTPLRVFIDGEKAYRDVDFATITKAQVLVDSEKLELDWRWKKEGSDEKVFSGKSYPNVEARYKFTLVNGQTLEGGVVTPIYIEDAKGRQVLVMDKKYRGPLDSQLKDLVYIKTLELKLADATAAANSKKTRKLPLIDD